MIVQRIFAVGLLISSSTSALAEPVFVQSGEHAYFSRLVTRVTNKGAWSVEQDDDKVTLKIENYSGGFDTERIFETIPKGRVKRVDADQNTLTIYLGCDCSVEAFDVDGGHVALDIISPDQRGTESAQTSRSPHPETVLTSPKPANLPFESNDSLLSRNATTLAQLATMSDIQMRLSHELGRGITRGVLEPNPPPPPQRRAQIDIRALDRPISNVFSEQGRKTANMRITTSMDIVKTPDSSQDTYSNQGLWCPPDDATDLASWGDDRSFAIQISEARQNLFGEFDRLNPDAAVNLGKKYLYFGFGAEARQVLGLSPEVALEYPLLMDIADLMETGRTATDISIESYGECGGGISIWAFLANHDNAPAQSIDPSVLLLALSQLPTHLRQHLAPILSNQFLAHGDSTSAATVLRGLERLPSQMPPAGTMAQANVGLNDGQMVEGTQKLQDIAGANVKQSPEALVRLVDAKIAAGEMINPEIAGLVDAYAQELRDTDLGPELRRSYILTLVETQAFAQALRELKLSDSLNDDDVANELWTTLMNKLTDSASDLTFLEVTFQQSPESLSQLKTDTKIPLAARLLKLGFDERAHDIIESVPDIPLNQVRQIVAAKIALALDQPYQALAELLNSKEKGADILRAEAKTMAGSHDEAFVLYQNAGHQNAALQSGWLADNWQDLIPSDTPVFGQLAALVESAGEPIEERTGMLSRTTAALNESKNARQTITDFLSAPELQMSTE